MKPNAPWSVKGIERDARETAKEAARREGMTVGEWLSQVIYTAGDPESSNGEIEGIRTSDIVNAIEHLNKRVISTESRSASALDELSRNVAIMVERLQRVERRPAGAGGSPDVEDRLARLEEKTSDRNRVDALRALEKAVGQVALQFDAAQKSSLVRIEAIERQMQELASRFDGAGPDETATAAAIDHLKGAIDGMAARLSRAERIASEATKLNAAAAAPAVDADFVERTGARLRVLGDEIKRGGDQIRTLEGSIRKMSEQIDAAEKRSAEGVEKVSETIIELRRRLAEPPPAPPAAAIEAAVAAVTQRTEDRIAALQRSFEAALAKLETPAVVAAPEPQPSLLKTAKAVQSAPPASVAPVAPTSAPSSAPPSAPLFGKASAAALRARVAPPLTRASVVDQIDDADLIEDAPDDDTADTVGAFNLDSPSADAAGEIDEDDGEAAFSFDLDTNEIEPADAATDYPRAGIAADILSEVKDAFAGVKKPAPVKMPAETAPDEDADEGGIEAMLAEFDSFDEDETEDEEGDDDELGVAPLMEGGAQPESGRDYLRAARQAAREAAERAAEQQQAKRILTPRQRAIIAAKMRRKRLEEQGLSLDAATQRTANPAAEAELPPEPDFVQEAAEVEKPAPGPSLAARASTLAAGLRAKLPGATPRKTPAPRGFKPSSAPEADDEFTAADEGRPAPAAAPDLFGRARGIVARAGSKPVTLALGAAIVLAAVALVFLVRDLMSGREETPSLTIPARAPASETVAATGDTPEVPVAPAVNPRGLYLDAVARLKTATTEADTAAALESLEQAAALGHAPAQLQLGELYKLGQGVEQDPEQARLWYTRAANGGNVLAMHRVGVMAARGQGGALDAEAAIAWFEKASGLGLVDSQYNLGAIFHPGGDGTTAAYQDAAKAYYWYALAARNGDDQAATLAASLAASLTPAQRREIDASVDAWAAATPDESANEVAPAS